MKKKKLKISALRVSSFITSADQHAIRGGESKIGCNLPDPDTDTQTMYTCYTVVSANPLQCVQGSYGIYCVRDVLTNIQVTAAGRC